MEKICSAVKEISLVADEIWNETEIRKLDDISLLSELRSLVQRERNLHTQIIRFLKEVETRKLYLERGYSSLFAFCTESLGLTGNEAYTRIEAMRLLKQMPELEEKFESGALSLSVAAKAQTAFRKMARKQPITKSRRETVLKKIIGMSVRETEKVLAIEFPEIAPGPEIQKPISENWVRLECTVSKELAEKLETLRAELAHQNPEGTLAGLLEILVENQIKKMAGPAPRRKIPMPQKSETNTNVTRNAEFAKEAGADINSHAKDIPSLWTSKVESAKPQPRHRYIPAQTRRDLESRIKSCGYRDPVSKRVCGSKYALEIDHIVPVSGGGRSNPENLQWLCDAHNRHKGASLLPHPMN